MTKTTMITAATTNLLLSLIPCNPLGWVSALVGGGLLLAFLAACGWDAGEWLSKRIQG